MSTTPDIETPEYVRDIAEIFPPQGGWTERDYFALPETNRLIELAHGQLRVVEMPTELHQRILRNLILLIGAYLKRRPLGQIWPAPLKIRLRPGLIREPDLVFFFKTNLRRVAQQVSGIPDLVVEIHSAGTRETDRVDKFREYAEAGIAEYWMVEPETETVEVYELRDGAYALRGAFRPGDTLTSGLLPGLDLPVAEVFAA
ncbi:MAG: Uma2 family endonuclease [Anaerolineales bacterium]|nr:Uma2 family endonuclease [Anaerolineales bacterium]